MKKEWCGIRLATRKTHMTLRRLKEAVVAGELRTSQRGSQTVFHANDLERLRERRLAELRAERKDKGNHGKAETAKPE